MSVKEKMTAIASAIRSKTGGTEKLGLDQMAAGVEQVYEVGQKDSYDAFWDAAQAGGSRNNYNRGFCGHSWTDTTFAPKYDIKPTAIHGFYNCFAWSQITDLTGILRRQGVTLDTSGCGGDMSSTFSNAAVTHVPVIDVRNASSAAHLFAFCSKLQRVEGLVLSAGVPISYAFGGCTALEHILFSGTLGQNGLDLKECTKLDKESITSVINTLSTATSGLSVTLSKTAVQNAFGYYPDFDEIYQDWYTLIDTKPNWTINLA